MVHSTHSICTDFLQNRTKTTRTPVFWDTPCCPWLPILMIHIRSRVKTWQRQNYKCKKLSKIQILKFCKKLYTRPTLWSSLIRCITMKWIQPEVQALQSGQGMWDGRTDRRTDGRSKTNIPPTTLLCGGIITHAYFLSKNMVYFNTSKWSITNPSTMEPGVIWEFPSPPIGDLDCRDVIIQKPCIAGAQPAVN